MSINPEAFPGLTQQQVADANAVDGGIPDAGDPATDALAAKTIAELEKEFAYQEPVPGEGEAPEVTTAPQTPAETPPGTPPAETPKPPSDAGLERLVAREVEIRERERAIDARETAVRAKEGVKDPSLQNLMTGLRTDPEAALKAAGVDVDHAVRLIIAKRLGEKAPPELRAAVRDAEIQRELNELRAHNESMRATAANRDFYVQVSNSAREYVNTGISKDAPGLSELAKDSPDWVHERVIEEITRDAQERVARRDTSDALLSFPDAAKRVEKKFAPVLSRSTKQSTSADATTAQKPASPQTSAPPAPNKQPSAPKPLRPWQMHSEQDLLDAGIKEALMEYRKHGS